MTNPVNKALSPEVRKRIQWLRKECGFGAINITKLLNAEAGVKHKYAWYTVQDFLNGKTYRGA